MGSTVLYVLEWALALLLLLAVYKLFFSGTTLHRFNRCYLLGATVLSALLPFVHLTMPQAKGISIQSTSFAHMLQEVTIYADAPAEETVAQTASDHTWAWILVGIWALYVIVLITGWTRSIIRTERFLKGKPVHRIGGIRIVSHDEEFGPFSWMNCIVISKEEDGFARRASMRHELSHIRLGHYADLVFLLACTIVNPVCWLIMKEIKIVHEYEADDEVINRYGIKEKDYQRLLIMRTVGAEAYALASSFNLNIKQRITMMKKEKTLKRRTLWLLAVLPVIAIMSVVCSNTVSAAEILNQPVLEEPVKAGDVIKGTITDEEGNPMMMVSINEKDDTERIRAHSISDINGEYSFRLVNESDRLTIDYIGYESVNLPIDKKVINITLKGFDPNDLNMPMLEDDGYSEEETPFMVVEEMPEFPGGTTALLEYIRTSIKYPEEARAKKAQGRVMISFIVEKDGSITDVKLVKQVDPQLDAEAIRMISEMPKWKPGRQRGQEVRVRFTVPVSFMLN